MSSQKTTKTNKDIDEITTRQERLKKLERQKINPYPSTAYRSHTLAAALQTFEHLEKSGTEITVVGRIKGIRNHGGSTFVDLEDGSGTLQLYAKEDKLGKKFYQQFADFLDVGDFIQGAGVAFKTKRGEPTLLLKEWQILTKSILPLPEKWHGLQDIEIRFRKRYLDLISNPEMRRVFTVRSEIIRTIRLFLDSRGYLEVETPVLQPIPGGANARPFVTHHNTLNTDLYLRIAPELYLKRLIVGGFERVYEIARCFRNEGIDWAHNPEFTQVELYRAYGDYESMMEETEDLMLELLQCVDSGPVITYQEKEIIFKRPFKRLSFRNALIKYAKLDIEKYPDQASLYKKARAMGLKDITARDGRGKICDELYKEFVRKHLVQPTFIIDHPVELSPLAKQKAKDPRYVERFQLVLGEGLEMCNAFSELNDPKEQRARFEDQQKLREKGDEEAQQVDEDFIEALSHGMPPTVGFGMGIDRLVSLLTDQRNIKEVILFPTLRPKA